MSSPAIPVRRRRRLDYESDDDEDFGANPGHRTSPSSNSSKRARSNNEDTHSPTASLEPVLPNDYRSHSRNRRLAPSDKDDGSDNDEAANGRHQPGAIVRVKVTNFVTYEEAVFYPGPNLNMVIGPNGTGKSSLVCAICLGLGYSSSHLGRAGKIGEFVKHGKDDATIEIELQGRPDDAQNPVVKVRITRDGDKRKWWLNSTEVALKNVQNLTRKFGIQVDNLCQFLPQDRVAEFAGLNSVDLLHHTQRAAAPEEMLVWHDSLKKLRKEQKALQLQHETDLESLENNRSRQEGLREDVERLREREQVDKRIRLLEKTKPFVEYKAARQAYLAAKHKKKEAQSSLQDLERQIRPAMQEVNEKEDYHGKVSAVVNDRHASRENAGREADKAISKVEEIDDKITKTEQKRKAEYEGDKRRKQDLQKILQKIKQFENQLENAPPPEVNTEDWNRRIRAKEHRIRDIEAKLRELGSEDQELRQQAVPKKKQITQAETQIASLESQVGKQVNKLRQRSPESAQAWDWIQENRDSFENTVYGPPIVECSIKDPRYVDQVESLFQQGNFLTFTVQSTADFQKLSKVLYRDLRLADIQINTATRTLGEARRPPISDQQLHDFGLDFWALDLIDGPEPVLSMLCSAVRAHSTGIALHESTEAQFAMLVDSPLTTFVTGRHSYNTTRRREYGAGAVSTTTKAITQAKVWTDQPVDAAEKRDLQENIDSWNEELKAMGERVKPIRQQIQALKEERTEVTTEVNKMKDEKNMLQAAQSQYKAIPDKLKREKESLEEKIQKGRDFRQRVQILIIEHDNLVLKKAALSLEHQKHVVKLRTCHEDCLEAEIRLLEASSDVEALKQRNIGITQQLAAERRLKIEAEEEANQAKAAASRALGVCKIILGEAEDEETRNHYQNTNENITVEELDQEIDAERAKLDLMHGGNPGAMKEFQARQLSIAKLEDKVAETSKNLESLHAKITNLRDKWEPELDKLIKEISDAFAYNFEQISCAGEVGVHKDDDFDLWAIEIKVKFRENETLQILDQHRQSGGERAVSTIFYLMALQSLARAPFRVVDEINQGMDPRNERMVHERMVEIACKEHTSQYFLITPKLLTNLRYHPRMKVLCIASGEHMPADHSLLDVNKAIELRRAIMAM